MLFLQFHLGKHRYLLDVRQVVEVLPMVQIMAIAQAPAEVAGLFRYRGALVPAIDLSQVLLGQPALRRLHTRIVLVRYRDKADTEHLLGLIVEKLTDTHQRPATDFSDAGVSLPHLRSVATDAQGLTQQLDVSQLLPAAVHELLFRQAAPC